MDDMRLSLDEGESLVVNVGNVRVHVWSVGDNILSLSTSVDGKADDIQVTVDSGDGKVTKVKAPKE